MCQAISFAPVLPIITNAIKNSSLSHAQFDKIRINAKDHLTTRVSAPRLLLPDDAYTDNHDSSEGARSPLIICFHGSGETCSPAWDDLATKLVAETQCRVLLYNRELGNLRAADVAAQMWDYVRGAEALGDGIRSHDEPKLGGPYLLVAHSYGGAFARAFIQHERLLSRVRHKKSSANRVLGLVLAETGQEGGLDPALDELQIRRTIMGDRPVCVIRGNSLIAKWKALEESGSAVNSSEAETGDIAARRQILAAEREMLLCVDAEDERLKRRQLGLSRNSRFVHLPDCGHHVIRDRLDEVVAAVRWVLENAESEEQHTSPWKQTLERLKRFRLRR
ncbi:Alpha/Beta hydrolase protein [Xylaria acuta]|nr:Alpha/Beta hydrolase protein [Xylaria acuta]